MTRTLSRRDLARAERELERIGLLLLHDAVLPSFTGLVVGRPFRGSWWSHPRAHEIYDLLQLFDEGPGALSVKLVDGKVTYVHPRLWPAVLNAARGGGAWRDDHSRAARDLLGVVLRRGSVRADQIASARSLGPAIRELEARLRIHTASVHTESGSHRKLLRTWPRWCRDSGYAFERYPPLGARRELQDAAARLAGGSGRAVALPWTRA